MAQHKRPHESIPRCECGHLIFDHRMDGQYGVEECRICDCETFVEDQ